MEREETQDGEAEVQVDWSKVFKGAKHHEVSSKCFTQLLGWCLNCQATFPTAVLVAITISSPVGHINIHHLL